MHRMVARNEREFLAWMTSSARLLLFVDSATLFNYAGDVQIMRVVPTMLNMP